MRSIKVKILLYSGETYITETNVPLIDIMGYIDTKETITIGDYGLRTNDIKRVIRVH